MTGTDLTCKMKCFDYFRRALHLGRLISSSYATVYLTTFTFSHVVFSGVAITDTSKMDCFPNILNGF